MSTNDKVIFNNSVFTFESLGLDLNNSTIDTLLPLIPEKASFMGWVGDSNFRTDLNKRCDLGKSFYGHLSITKYAETWNCNYINYDSNLTYSAKYTNINSKGWSAWENTMGIERIPVSSSDWSYDNYIYKFGNFRILSVGCKFPKALAANTVFMSVLSKEAPLIDTYGGVVMNKSPYYNAVGVTASGKMLFTGSIAADTTVRGILCWVVK